MNENAKKDLKEGLLLYNTENNVGLKNAWNIIQAEVRGRAALRSAHTCAACSRLRPGGSDSTKKTSHTAHTLHGQPWGGAGSQRGTVHQAQNQWCWRGTEGRARLPHVQCPALRDRQHSHLPALASRKELALAAEAKRRSKRNTFVSSPELQGGSIVGLGWPGQEKALRRLVGCGE